MVASFALTEPGAGSNPAGLRTKAVRDGDDWVIDGEKKAAGATPAAAETAVPRKLPPAAACCAGIAARWAGAPPPNKRSRQPLEAGCGAAAA